MIFVWHRFKSKNLGEIEKLILIWGRSLYSLSYEVRRILPGPTPSQ